MPDALFTWLERWRGVVLAAVATVTTIWLAGTGQLILYIHPRYVVFTVIMASVALIASLVSVLARKPHDHDDPPSRRQRLLSTAAVVASIAVAAGMIAIPPATLTSSTAVQRDIAGSSQSAVSSEPVSTSASSTSFSVLDWASLLRQSSDVGFYADKPADVVGFVTADASDPENLFYVSRFVITCCAVDAQPVGVPVYSPGWSSTYKADDWVSVAGSFATNPSASSDTSIVLVPTSVTSVKQPNDPYLF